MVGGWFVFGVVACIVIGCGFVLAVSLLRAAWAQKEREALTSEDLRVLEESAVLLIDDLKTETDTRISRLDDYSKRIEGLLREADLRIVGLQKLVESQAATIDRAGFMPRSSAGADFNQVNELLSRNVDCAEVARNLGLDCAEVKLIHRLASLQAN
jgi:hypothetical protein